MNATKNLLKKITMKDVNLGKARLQEMIRKGELKEETPILHVAGIATDTKTGSGTYGDWTAMIGQFWALNLLDEKEYLSRSCILPPLAQDLTVDALKADKSVQFAYVITAVPDATREATGVKYGIRPVSEVKERDDVSGLKGLFGGTAPAPALTAGDDEHAEAVAAHEELVEVLAGEEAASNGTSKSSKKGK